MTSTHRSRALGLVAGAFVAALAGPAVADAVLLGSDYLRTETGTFIDLGPLGIVPLTGIPLPGLADADTIVRRLTDTTPFPGPPDTIPIEIVALQLRSVQPVELAPASFFDVFVTLDPLAGPSTGMMQIGHAGPDTNDPNPEGQFSSFFDVFYDVDFYPVGGGPLFLHIDGNKTFTGQGLWSHEPFPWSLLVPGNAGDPAANWHFGAPLGWRDFFPFGWVIHDTGGARHVVSVANPEPSTLGLGALGGAVLLCLRMTRRAKRRA
jgi:hypothetical protein